MADRPRIVMTLLVRDEQDVIAHNLRYHLARGVDHVLVMDNLSTDATVSLVAPFVAAGLVTLLREPDDNYAQGKWVTRMAKMARNEFGADWVINSDADEFWWPREGDLRTTLNAVPSGVDIVVAQRHDLSPVAGEQPFYDRMIWREVHSTNLLGRALPPKVCHRASADVLVHQGNHDVDGMTGSRLDDGHIEILHVPLRSYAQFRRKITLGSAAYSRNTELPAGIGDAWRQMGVVAEQGRLEQVYRSRELNEADGPAAVAAGTHVEDLRLRNALRALS